MQFYLVKFSADYADEFDVYGFCIMTEIEYKEFMNDLKKVDWPSENYFGTNEAIECESYEDYMRSVTVTDISQSEYDTIKRCFGRCWGNFIDPSEY